MSDARNLNRHAAMMNRMAQVLGIDLTAEMAQGRMSGSGWKDALIRCTGCAAPEQCTLWLSAHDPEGETPATETPHYCENRLMMKRLRAEKTVRRILEVQSEGGM